MAAFCLLIPTYVISATIDPGYITKKFDFIGLTEEFLDNNLDLVNLCTYDEVIKTETSFHCMFCGRCVEHFDHHCPFINNCLGYRNHKYFLVFIFSYMIFVALLALETIRHLTDAYLPCEPPTDGVCTSPCVNNTAGVCSYSPKNNVGWYSITILVLIGLNLPIIIYQVFI